MRISIPWFWQMLLAVLLVGQVQAAGLDDLASDFSAVEGTLILARGGQYLVDLDAGQGIMVGDLLVSTAEGEAVIHPLTGLVVGNLGTAPSIFQVSLVDQGFSRMQLIAGEKDVAPGTQLARYQGLTALLQDGDGTAAALYSELRQRLPQLRWQGHFSGTESARKTISADLNFSYGNGQLLVDFRDKFQLRSYAVTPAPQQEKTVASASPQVAGRPSVAASVPKEGGGYHLLGEFGGETRMAAFSRYRGQFYLATTDGLKLRVLDVKESLRQLTELSLPVLEESLALSWWQPNAEGDLYLAVTSAVQRDVANSVSVETEISSALYRFDGEQLVRQYHLLGLLLGSFDLDGDGNPETLFSEPFDESSTSAHVQQIEIVDGKLKRLPMNLVLPAMFRVNGTALVDLTGDGELDLAQVAGGYLTIDGGTPGPYRSARKIGGSLSRLTYDHISGGSAPLFGTRVFEIPPLAVDLSTAGHMELLVASAKLSSVTAPGLGPGVDDTWLTQISYLDGRFRKHEFGPHLENPIQGIGFDNKRILVVSVKPDDFFGKGGRTEVLEISLDYKD